MDVRAFPSPTNINFWHIDTYRADRRLYCGNYCLWCGSDSLWTDGKPVECNTWAKGKKPGYGDSWNCIVQLTLPDTFDVANGCTLYFDPRYDTECKYDYFYVDFFDGTEWQNLAAFNASSNNPGDPCGNPGTPNPDYWSNTDTGQPNSADWQERFDPGLPAFYRVITPDTLIVASGPMFRWRFVSDTHWSDRYAGDTDGAAFVDNVWVWGDGERYEEDFESGVLDTSRWSLPDPAGVIDLWHVSHDPDPPGEGEVGMWTCKHDSSNVYRGRPEGGYQSGQPWRNQWYYRLVSPRVALENTGCVMQYDVYCLTYDWTGDYGLLQYRFYDGNYEQWCPWERSVITYSYSWCSQVYFWWLDENTENVAWYADAAADSVQFAWELYDSSHPDDPWYGKHKDTDFQVDNVSIGFFDANATVFRANRIDLLHDTFHDNLCAFNSSFSARDPDSVSKYSGPPYDDIPLRKDDQLWVEVGDDDGLVSVELWGSVDGGAGWISKSLTLGDPYEPGDSSLGGDYYGTFCPDDFSLDTWDLGTTVCYYVKAVDNLANQEYWPARADPANQYHTGTPEDYFTFSVLPGFPEDFGTTKVLLVDGFDRHNYDFAPCVESVQNYRIHEDIYEETLNDAGYCYDKYDISNAGSNVHIHPVWFDYYDCVVWLTGPYFDSYCFDQKAQEALRDYLGSGGKVILCGDRIAYSVAFWEEDYLGGEFGGGIMGCEYLEEMEFPSLKPYLYAAGVESLLVLGSPKEIDLDTLLVYRDCPYLKQMSYVAVIDSPPAGYTAQPLVAITNASVGDAVEVIYTEYQGAGQCAFVNFDLSASVNHERGYCSGVTPGPTPGFDPGVYEGRVDLMRVILEDVFGLPACGGAGIDPVDPPVEHYRWALGQNTPNPCVTGTEIRYETARQARVTIRVYDALGRQVCVLVDGVKPPGEHLARWDGRNDRGERVTSGVYFYNIEAGEFSATRKMLVLR
jgi:hypothetical protein